MNWFDFTWVGNLPAQNPQPKNHQDQSGWLWKGKHAKNAAQIYKLWQLLHYYMVRIVGHHGGGGGYEWYGPFEMKFIGPSKGAQGDKTK